MELRCFEEAFALDAPFTISRGTKTHANVLRVTVSSRGVTGQGECVPYARYGETFESVRAQLSKLEMPLDRATLQQILPAGAARNALDCALWDLALKLGEDTLPALPPAMTAYTLSLRSADEMHRSARAEANRPLLKIKLGSGADDLERLRAVHAGAPIAKLIVDANEGWTENAYQALLPHLQDCNVALVEQPFPVGQDAALAHLPRPVPICADESCHTRADLPALKGLYDVVNIKLDKTGGLTEALALRDAARADGFGIMVGCMVGTSLAMAPAMYLTEGADFVDLDGPLLLAHDRSNALRYEQSIIHAPEPALWG